MKRVSLCMCIFTLLPIFIEAGLLLQENDKLTEIVNSTILRENQPRFEKQYADPCSSRPCQNGGACTPSGNSFYCTCYAPFYGPRCEQSPCTNNPCYNDGICMVSGTSYACNCRPPYFGPRCELNPCLPNPCRNSGTCTLYQNYYLCTCIPPFVGINCETTNMMDPCTMNPCWNGGSCQRVGNSYSCKCRSGYSGPLCELNCKCKNGYCQKDAFGKAICNCLPEYGRISDTECKACNCGPGASCTFKGFFNTKTCSCPPYTYEQSGKCVELCGTKPCKNGKCRRDMVQTYCQCDTNYSGTYCETYSGKSKIYIIAGCVVIFVIAFMCFATYRYLQYRSRSY